jgi:hypothetical protein
LRPSPAIYIYIHTYIVIRYETTSTGLVTYIYRPIDIHVILIKASKAYLNNVYKFSSYLHRKDTTPPLTVVNLLMSFRCIIAVRSENHTKHTNALCQQNAVS